MVVRATREGCRPVSLWSPLGDGETQCLKVRPDKVSDGPSLRSQAVTRACGSLLAEQDDRPPSTSLSGVPPSTSTTG